MPNLHIKYRKKTSILFQRLNCIKRIFDNKNWC